MSLGYNQVDWDSTEFCYAPIIQSRGTTSGYDLRSNAESSADPLAHKGVLLVAVGIRYKGYCANVGRTFVVDPTKVNMKCYVILCVSYHYIGARSCLCTAGFTSD